MLEKLERCMEQIKKDYLYDIDFEILEEELISYVFRKQNDPFLKYVNEEQCNINVLEILGLKCKYQQEGIALIENFAVPGLYNILKIGDAILQINNRMVSECDLNKIIGAGQVVIVAIRGLGTNNLEMVREVKGLPQVKNMQSISNAFIISKKIIYIKICAFTNELIEEITDTLNGLCDTSSKKLIIDLRDNSGGNLNAALRFCGRFIDHEIKLLITRNRENEQNEITIKKSGVKYQFKEYEIWVNELSMSAAEIITIFFKQYKKALVKGKKTYGKGIICKKIRLDSNSIISIPTMEFCDINGEEINKCGIAPDIMVSDKEFETEIERLKSFMNLDCFI